MENYIYYQDIYKEYAGYGLSVKKNLEVLVRQGELKVIEKNGSQYYSKRSIKKYVDKMDKFRESHFSFPEFLKEMGIENVNSSRLQKNIYTFCKAVNIRVEVLDVSVDGMKRYVNKNSYYEFKKKYISVKNAFENYSDYKLYSAFVKNLEKNGIVIAFLKRGYDTMFVREKEVQVIFHRRGSVMTKGDLSKFLGIGLNYLGEILDDNGLEFVKQDIEPFVYLPKEKAVELKEKQEKLYKHFEDCYYILEELKEIGFTNKRRLEKVSIPHLAKIGKFKGKSTGYSKAYIESIIEKENAEINQRIVKERKEINKEAKKKEENKKRFEEKQPNNPKTDKKSNNENAILLKQKRKLKKEINALINSMVSDPFSTFRETLSVEDLHFTNNAILTQRYWFQFVESQFNTTNAHINTQRKMITRYRGTTKTLIEATQTKDLLAFSNKELKLAIFNDNVNIERQSVIYSFLRSINESLQLQGAKGLNLQGISNVQYKRQGVRKTVKEVYSIDEYMSLYSYVSDVFNHKKKAIFDVKNALDKKRYNNYDSVWLFVLLHMNNAWRANDCVELPRVDRHILNDINVNSIGDLQDFELSRKQAERIIKSYERKYLEHHKNGGKRTFYCSNELILPMAYAILICEFRCNSLTPLSNYLINFSNIENRLTDRQHDEFFKDHTNGVKFSSLKMNRTVITLLSQTIREKTGRNPLELVKYARGHVDSETTNIYVQFPQDYLDFLTEQLFNKGYFGYAYDMMASILLGEPPEKREDQTKRSLEIKEVIGDVAKIENISNYMNHMLREREDLKKYLEDLSKQEIEERLSLITLGQSPAKEENYQCLFSNCVRDSIDCNKCPFSIPHFYALSSIMDRIHKKILDFEKIINDDGIPIGEKRRVSNILMSDLILLKDAKSKFGEEALNIFLPDGYSRLREKIQSIPDPRKYLV